MQCANCNAELEPGATVCNYCGTPVPAAVDESASQATVLVSRQSVDMAASEEAPPEEETPSVAGPEEVASEEAAPEMASPVEEIPAEATSVAVPEVLPEAQPEPLPEPIEVEETPSQPESQDFSYASQPSESLPEASYIPPTTEEKVLGVEPTTAGIIALGLGIIGLLFSCVGCGGLFSLLGTITGAMTLKTSGRTTGLIGLILSIIGLIIALIVICAASSLIITSSSYSY